jgi:hypothetical protein
MNKAVLHIVIEPALQAALEHAARDSARSLPRFVETLLSEHLTATGYLRKVGEHGIPVSQLNSENDG